MADVYKALQPEKYLKEFFSKGFRPDGRQFEQFRWTVVNPGPIKTADGSCITKVGHTKVVCGVKAELTKPNAETPGEGFIVTNVELPPLCLSQFKPGAPGGTAQACNQLVADIFQDSQCINLEDLCIVKDKLAWVLYCDLICIDYDGAIVDACIMAIMTALKTVKLPKVEYNLATEMCVVNEDIRTKLNIQRIPVASTFTLFEGDVMITDPTFEEEKLCGGILGGIIIVRGVNYDEENNKYHSDVMRGIHRPGGAILSATGLQRAVSLAIKRTKLVQELITQALQQVNEDER